MSTTLTKVKEKYQITLPAGVRKDAGIAIGDILEAGIEGKNIVLRQKTVVDREMLEDAIAEGLHDLREGRVHGPFKSVKELKKSLQRA